MDVSATVSSFSLSGAALAYTLFVVLLVLVGALWLAGLALRSRDKAKAELRKLRAKKAAQVAQAQAAQAARGNGGQPATSTIAPTPVFTPAQVRAKLASKKKEATSGTTR